MGNGLVGSLHLALWLLAPNAAIARVHVGLRVVVVEGGLRARVAGGSASEDTVAALEGAPCQAVGTPGHLRRGVAAGDADRGRRQLEESRVVGASLPVAVALSWDHDGHPRAPLLAQRCGSYRRPTRVKAGRRAVHEGVLPH